MRGNTAGDPVTNHGGRGYLLLNFWNSAPAWYALVCFQLSY